MNELYPILFTPVLKEMIWGGTRLKEKYGRQSLFEKIGESWDIACHENGIGMVSNGSMKGTYFDELISISGERLLGSSLKGMKNFPLLIKLIHAADILSVQVHPSDIYAAIHEEGLGKTEMWYVIEARPNAELTYGLLPGTTKEDLVMGINDGDLNSCLNRIKVKAGDAVYIPAGTVHAIGDGILICEIQQNSDLTYRVYDWNRVGANGKCRSLHIEKALDVIDFTPKNTTALVSGITVDEAGGLRTFLVACSCFAVEKLNCYTKMSEEANGEKFFTLTAIEGSGEIVYSGGAQEFNAGDSILIPAALGRYEIHGRNTLIKAYVPDIHKDIIIPLENRGINSRQIEQLIAGIYD